MQTYIKAAIMTLCAVFLAFAFKSVGVSALGMDEETNALDDFGDMMLEARELFLQESEAFQELTMNITGYEGLNLRRRADGTAAMLRDGEILSAAEGFEKLGAGDPQKLTELAQLLFTGTEVLITNEDDQEVVNGYAQLLSLHVKDGEVLFFTEFHELGCVGVSYSPSGDCGGYNSIELIEDWRVFYQMIDS